MKDVIKAVEIIQDNIKNHEKLLVNNEAATRYALIDPLLRALGWDTSNPEMVRPEYRETVGRADYVLGKTDSDPTFSVEVKSLNTQLDEKIRRQAAGDRSTNKAHYIILTNGKEWLILDHDLNEKESFSIMDVDAARKSLIMYNDGVKNIQSIKDINRKPPNRIQNRNGRKPDRSKDENDSWHSISSITYTTGDKPPKQIKFPYDETSEIQSWVNILVQVATWLIQNERITKNNCPIGSGKTRYLLAIEPVHPSGKSFASMKKIHGLYLESNFAPTDCLRYTKELIYSANLKPNDFKFK